MALRITALLVVITAISYFHMVSSLTAETLAQLEKYITERAQRERAIFRLAEDDHAILKKEALWRLEKLATDDPRAEFDRLVTRWDDGVVRHRPEGFDFTRQVGIYIDKDATLDADLRRRVVAFHSLISAYGPAWHNRFQDTYFVLPENVMVIYWPDNNWAEAATASLNMPDEEYYWAGDQRHNPARKTVWTGLYYDHVARVWMVSAVTPIDVNGRQIASIGHDVILTELMERTVADRLEGTYNVVFRSDGRLIAHPDLMDRILESGGTFSADESGDPHLQRIVQLAATLEPGRLIVDNGQDDEYLAVARIDEPDWYLATVFPKSILTRPAFHTARFILLLGIISLAIELLILFLVLRSQIAAPLRRFMVATERIAAGSRTTDLDVKRQDELGQLARAFNDMVEALDVAQKAAVNAEVVRNELSKAREIQQRLLPKHLVTWPGQLEMAVRFRPARETSGDFYDVFELAAPANGSALAPERSPLQISVGDVAGKSIPAALVMALARTVLRAVVQPGREAPEPQAVGAGGMLTTIEVSAGRAAETMRLTSAVLHRDVGRREFVACALAVVEPRADGQSGPRLRLVNAGQVPPLLCRGGRVEELESPGDRLPLGVLPDPGYEDLVVDLQPGDVVVFTSDGLPEAPAHLWAVDSPTAVGDSTLVPTPPGAGNRYPGPAAPGEMFGFERLASSATYWAMQGADADAIAAGIWADVEAWSGEASDHDDMTLVVLRVPGAL